MTKLMKNHSLPLQIEGLPYIFAGLILTLCSIVVWKTAAETPSEAASPVVAVVSTVLFSLFTAFSVWFYRCPKVSTPNDEQGAVISTANGRVLHVREVSGERIGEAKAKKISIFMSPLDVHVNRAPITGVVESVFYHAGKFFKADLDKASEENEHNWVVLKSDLGPRIAFAQIAGFVARRIVLYIDKGARLDRGERYGMIRFGSRVEILLPMSAEVLVKSGDRTVAGETKIARLQITKESRV